YENLVLVGLFAMLFTTKQSLSFKYNCHNSLQPDQ
ncbi:MAG: hypothetical protein ACI8RD_004051, partial [Bacillariaceae sp.]